MFRAGPPDRPGSLAIQSILNSTFTVTRRVYEYRIKKALYIARNFMKEIIEDCDHEVGICWCQNKRDYQFIVEVLVELEDE